MTLLFDSSIFRSSSLFSLWRSSLVRLPSHRSPSSLLTHRSHSSLVNSSGIESNCPSLSSKPTASIARQGEVNWLVAARRGLACRDGGLTWRGSKVRDDQREFPA